MKLEYIWWKSDYIEWKSGFIEWKLTLQRLWRHLVFKTYDIVSLQEVAQQGSSIPK